jgi:hypothetical protein
VNNTLRVLVVGSCGKKKRTMSEKAPRCDDLILRSDLLKWQRKFSSLTIQAREMYIGHQNRELVNGVDLLRRIDNTEVYLKIISAGFGLLDERKKIPPYDCSFSGMKKSQIIERANNLEISKDFAKLCMNKFDLIYLALGNDYFHSLGDEWKKGLCAAVVGFNKTLSGPNILRIPSNHRIVHALSTRGYKIHGVTGYKGDLLRILANHALSCKYPYQELLGWRNRTTLQNLILHLSGLSNLD